MSQVEVTHNHEATRFEVHVGEHMGVLDYRLEPFVMVIHETRVPPELEGRGIGGALVKSALDYARADGLKVILECTFATSWVKRHPEYNDLVV